ncbi:hypothetical protein MKW92_026540 [Papaver armeniacum]|nr:hypothetical protein MKW92_026540 [Papaver armeniacum]
MDSHVHEATQEEAVKKRRRVSKKPYSRSIVGATLEVIQKRRAEKPEVRDAAREAALCEVKERVKVRCPRVPNQREQSLVVVVASVKQRSSALRDVRNSVITT